MMSAEEFDQLVDKLRYIFMTRAECEVTQDNYDGKLNETVNSLSKIETKLNMLLGILGAIGVAVLGIAVDLLFHV